MWGHRNHQNSMKGKGAFSDESKTPRNGIASGVLEDALSFREGFTRDLVPPTLLLLCFSHAAVPRNQAV